MTKASKGPCATVTPPDTPPKRYPAPQSVQRKLFRKLELQPLQQVLRKYFVGSGAGAVFVVVNDRFAEARRLGETRGARNDRLENDVPEVLPDFAGDLVRKIGPAVEHRHDDAEQLERGVHAGIAQLVEQPRDHRDPFERVVFALERNHEAVGGGERVQGQYAERGRTIQNDDVKASAVHDRLERLLDAMEMVLRAGEFEVGAAEIHFARDDFEPFVGGLLDLVEQRAFAQQRAVATGSFDFLQTQPAGGIGLRIEVEEKDAFAGSGEAGGEVDGSGGFSHAAFLIGDSYDTGRHVRDLRGARC